MAFLAVLLTSAWKGIGRFPVDIMVRSQLLQEMDLAVAALSRDVGGFMPIPSSDSPPLPPLGNYGGTSHYCLVGCQNNNDDRLDLSYDTNGDETSDIVVTYYLADDPNDAVETKILVREYDGNIFTVARYVEDLVVSKSLDFEWIVVELTFKHPHPRSDHTRKLTLHLKCME